MTKPPRTTTRQPKPEPKRSNRARSVSELLPDVGRAAFRKFGFVQHAVVSRWSEIVGDRYARVSSPESIRFPQGKRAEGVLSLIVAGAHAPMMQHIAPEIVERVNRFFGYTAVARLQIRHGEVKRPKPAAPPPELKPLTAEMGESLRGIVDPELKAVLEALASGVAAANIPKIGRIDLMRLLMLALSALSGAVLVATPPAAAQAKKPAAAKKAPARAPVRPNWTATIVKTPEGGYRIGNPNARLKLVEYGSRSCPTCGRFAADSKTLVTKYVASGRVSWEFRDYPVHPQDIAISMLGRCVPTGAFFRVLDGMFAGQAGFNARGSAITDARFAEIQAMPLSRQSRAWADTLGYTDFMKRNGLTEPAIQACLTNRPIFDELVKLADVAVAAGVQGTPTFFLNGERVNVFAWSQLEPLLQ